MSLKGQSGWYCAKCHSESTPIVCHVYLNWYCKACDQWLEKFACDDPTCLCKRRPEKPSEVKYDLP